MSRGQPSPGVLRHRAGLATAKAAPPAPRLPEPGPPVISLENALAWLKAEGVTAALGAVSLPVIEARTAACLACPHRGQRRAKPDEVGYCLVCGCGDSERGRLSRKVAMRAVKRPKQCQWPAGDER